MLTFGFLTCITFFKLPKPPCSHINIPAWQMGWEMSTDRGDGARAGGGGEMGHGGVGLFCGENIQESLRMVEIMRID